MSRSYSKKEAKEMLTALERQARDIVVLATQTEKNAHQHSFHSYRQFRDKISEFETFGILIENRLRNLETGRDERLDEQFDALNILISKAVLRTSTKFFLALSKSPALPIGSREIFVQELRNLHMAREKLAQPRYAHLLDEEADRNMKVAESILNEIIERAPSLLNL